jgi:hypothetical protein
MSFEPISAVLNLVETGLDKFIPDRMDEADKKALKAEMTKFMAQQALTENSEFRDFILQYEGAARDIPTLLVWFRSAIRPAFTCLVGYLDYLYFTGATTSWHPEGIALLKAINIIVLAFWFGERALKNSGLVGLLMKKVGTSK